ncbi:hypothetical protein WN51_12520 [Melipona quadrifasciata]|uniref:Uncharacterized protein n=1 Tax=Melipona quadrifasciata TaxID=166423 RepID=A0A0M9A4Y6_9HYME|nr:hypothetical protein WN51_12520 [Melipona quadrifasciata]
MASAIIGTVPTVKFDTAKNRRRDPIADRATRVQRQPKFVRLVAGGAVREYQGTAKDTPSVQRAPQSSQGYNYPAARIESVRDSTGQRPRRQDDLPRPDPANRTRSIVQRARAHRHAYAQERVLPANLRPAEQHSQSNRQQRVPPAPKPAHSRAVEKPAPQSRSATIQWPLCAKSVKALEDLDRVSRLLQSEGALSEREPEQLNPQSQPADRVQKQNNLPASTHVVVYRKMNSRREPLLPDIDDAHHANIIELITPEARDHNDAGGFLAANYGKQQQQDDCTTSDSEILDSSHSIDIFQTTSPHDESTQEQGTSATENQQQAHCLDGEDAMENLNSSKMKSSTTSGSSCVCNLTNAKTVASLDHSISVHDPHAKKYIPRISSSFDGANEEFFGAAYINGQISVDDSNRSSFQINCTRNWENLSSIIDASTTSKEFWSQSKCENSPSTPQTIEKIRTKSE